MPIANQPDDSDFPYVNLPADAASPDTIVRILIDELVRSGRLPQEHAASSVERILQRESLGATAIGRGIAIPHAKTDAVDEVIGIFGRCPDPIPWLGSIGNQRVTLVCLLLTPESKPGDGLVAIESLARYFRDRPDAM
jgi:mannitol/fructose-specific phosphotransferase system IIA component (Ntr-type)